MAFAARCGRSSFRSPLPSTTAGKVVWYLGLCRFEHRLVRLSRRRPRLRRRRQSSSLVCHCHSSSLVVVVATRHQSSRRRHSSSLVVIRRHSCNSNMKPLRCAASFEHSKVAKTAFAARCGRSSFRSPKMAFEATVAPALLRGNGSSGPPLHFPNYYAGFRRYGFRVESHLPRLNMSYQMSELVFFDVVIDRLGRRGPLHRRLLCGCDSARSSPSCFAAAASSSVCAAFTASSFFLGLVLVDFLIGNVRRVLRGSRWRPFVSSEVIEKILNRADTG